MRENLSTLKTELAEQRKPGAFKMRESKSVESFGTLNNVRRGRGDSLSYVSAFEGSHIAMPRYKASLGEKNVGLI